MSQVRLGRPPKCDPDVVMAMLASGMSQRGIARSIGVTNGTVTTCVKKNNIREKLDGCEPAEYQLDEKAAKVLAALCRPMTVTDLVHRTGMIRRNVQAALRDLYTAGAILKDDSFDLVIYEPRGQE